MNRMRCLFLFPTLAGLLAGQLWAAGVKPVSSQAQLFDLNQVRLLDGPLKVAQENDAAYLLKLDPDRLLAWFRKEAGLKPKAEVYGGWESRNTAGHTGGDYLSALAQMFAATGNPEFSRRADYMVRELAECQKANGNGYVAAIPGGKKAFSEIQSGNLLVTPNKLNGLTVPWYVIDKELAGLLYVHQLCHNDEALAVAEGLANWTDNVVGGLSLEQMQKMLSVEHGGMADSLAKLYGATGNTKYLDLAKKFRHDRVFLPLSQGRDVLDGLHANTQIPKFIGYQRIYELTGDTVYGAAAENFWKTVTQNRSWVIGGDGEHERFFPVDQFEAQMDDAVGPETCCSYNMLKLTEHLFQFQPAGKFMDYYERTLYNHILASMRPRQDGFVYYTSMAPGSYRTYSTDFESFWCCVGTGMQNHAKYGRMIYAHEGADKLLVNLFIASTLDWQDAGIKIEQKTAFPEEQGTTLVFHTNGPKSLEVDMRYPSWVAPGALKFLVNGQPQPANAQPGQYAAIRREWKEGDTLQVATPMTLHTEMLPHSSNYVAILYGPVVLAGELGTNDLDSAAFTEWKMNPKKRTPSPVIGQPVSAIESHLKPVKGEPLTFVSEHLMEPTDVRLIPFYDLYDQRYTIYWHIKD